MLLDEDELQKAAEKGDPDMSVGPIQIPHRPEVTKIRPYQYIYGKYELGDSENNRESLYYRPKGTSYINR